jgi:sulfane dehydrogenase subunit SoxC
MDDALVAYGQNGEALRPEQGYPVRLLLPGIEGNASVKWLRRIEVADQPFMTREETSRYTDPLPDGTARMFSLVMDAKSIITEPAWPDRLEGPGWREIRGLAWSGRGRITRVEVSADNGRTWHDASLDEPVLPKCHTRFRLPWEWKGGVAVLMSRATDDTGYVQPTTAELLKVRGPNTQYHFNNIRAWQVAADGTVRLMGGAA